MLQEEMDLGDGIEDDPQPELRKILAEIDQKLQAGSCSRAEMEAAFDRFNIAMNEAYRRYCGRVQLWNETNPTEEPIETVSFQEFSGANRR